MAVCEKCGKTLRFGRNVSHSKRRTPRVWRPNIRRVTLVLEGTPRRLNLCTRCLRSYHKVGR